MDSCQSPGSFWQPRNAQSDVDSGCSVPRGDCLPDIEANSEALSDADGNGEDSSDSENEMLRYAITLSLQEDNEDDEDNPETVYSDDEDDLMRCAIMLSLQDHTGDYSSNTPANSSNIQSTTAHDLDNTMSPYSKSSYSTIIRPSRLTNLPPELKEIICSYVFSGETIVVKPGKDPKPKLLITWGQHLSILLVSRELNSIASHYVASGEVILDIRQYRVRQSSTGSHYANTFVLEDLLGRFSSLTAICSKMMIRQGQYFECDDLESFLPALTHIEQYDYKACREVLRESGLYAGSMFEYEVPMKTRTRATVQLKELQDSIGPSICADLIYVCDTLVCVPKHEVDISNAQDAEGESVGKASIITRWKNVFKKGDENESKRNNVMVAEQNTGYKTAKMRHLILFNRSNPEGIWLSKEWVVAGLGVQSLSLGDIIAIHCHDYCLELIERGETVGI